MAKTKKELVKMIVNKELEEEDHDFLIDLLVENPISRDVDRDIDETSKFGDKVADKLSSVAGSWRFIIGFLIFIIIWIILNIEVLSKGFDPYPFILLNLFLSCLAAFQAPIIMMSQNRQAEIDRQRSENDYKVDTKSELILEDLHEKIVQVLKTQREIQREMAEIQEKIKKVK